MRSREMVTKVDEERAAAAAKVTRLRDLRLAKEAAERAAMPAAAPPKRARVALRRASETT